ncbi:MAG: GNAT family N-acetyltransferase, partial [Firmicutes bacterium]|nr:GNAT family N-acetyltransferase [Bacillota bacterium]
RPGDRVLICETCSHNPQGEDIGRVKIPRWLAERAGGPLDITVAVSKDFRRQGVATRLLRALSDAAAEEGIKDITLEVRPSNKAAIALYEGLGFRQEGLRKQYYDDLEDAIIMWRRGK